MKLETDKNILQFFTMSLVMILSGALMVAFFQARQVQMFGASIILGGLMLALMGLYVSTKPKDHFLKDERSVRINEKAGYQALLIIIVMISIINSINLFWKLDILFKDVAPILFIVGVYSWIVLRWHYNKKSEI